MEYVNANGIVKRFMYVKENSELTNLKPKELLKRIVAGLNPSSFQFTKHLKLEREYFDTKDSDLLKSNQLYYIENMYEVPNPITRKYIGTYLVTENDSKIRSIFLGENEEPQHKDTLLKGVDLTKIHPVVFEKVEVASLVFGSNFSKNNEKGISVRYSSVIASKNGEADIIATTYVIELRDYGISPVEDTDEFRDISNSFIKDAEPLNALEIHQQLVI